MRYSDNIKALRSFYNEKGLQESFDEDNHYLKKAFGRIQELWLENFEQIKKIKYLMIAEAPLWGYRRKYVYNPEINNSQFFYRSDLGDILNKNIGDKKEFIKCCNEIGLLIIDISPFALNASDTKINYRQLSSKEYLWLVGSTMSTYFEKKIELINEKRSDNIQVFFRYSRVKQTFRDLVASALMKNKLIASINDIGDISQNGGGIDKKKLEQIIKRERL